MDVDGIYCSRAAVLADPETVCPYKEVSWRDRRQTMYIMYIEGYATVNCTMG